MLASDALGLLKSDPLALLVAAHVSIAGGGSSSESGNAVFGLGLPASMQGIYKDSCGRTLPTVQIIHIGKTMQPTKFKQGTEEYLTFSAYYVAMKRMSSAPGGAPTGTFLTLSPYEGGTDLCITSLLTGCTFGIGSSTDDGTCLVSHIQPQAGAVADRAAMAGQTQQLFGQAPDVLVEKGVTYTDRATVIGHRLQRKWSFFMQAANGGTRVVDPPVVL